MICPPLHVGFLKKAISPSWWQNACYSITRLYNLTAERERNKHFSLHGKEESSSSSWLFIIVQWLSCVWLFMILWTAAYQASSSFIISWSLLKLMSIESVRSSNQLILCHSLLLLPSVFPSIRVFSSDLALYIRWPKYWSFSFGISPSNEYSGLISFRIDWFDLLGVQETLKSLLQVPLNLIFLFLKIGLQFL